MFVFGKTLTAFRKLTAYSKLVLYQCRHAPIHRRLQLALIKLQYFDSETSTVTRPTCQNVRRITQFHDHGVRSQL